MIWVDYNTSTGQVWGGSDCWMHKPGLMISPERKHRWLGRSPWSSAHDRSGGADVVEGQARGRHSARALEPSPVLLSPPPHVGEYIHKKLGNRSSIRRLQTETATRARRKEDV